MDEAIMIISLVTVVINLITTILLYKASKIIRSSISELCKN